MSTADLIRQKLEDGLNPSFLEIVDESQKHVGHVGRGSGGHYRIKIIAPCFTKNTLLERHRMIYRLLGDLIPNEVHALAICASDSEKERHEAQKSP